MAGDVRRRAGHLHAFQRITLLLVFAAMIALLYALFRTSALATEDGLRVINGYKVRELEWAEIVRLTFSRNRPWALLDLADGSTVSVMAIQTSDGERATRRRRQAGDGDRRALPHPRND